MIEEICHFEDEDDGTCAACSYGTSCGCCASFVRWADCPVNKLQTERDAVRAELADAEPAVRALHRRLKLAEARLDAARAELADRLVAEADSRKWFDHWEKAQARLDAVIAVLDEPISQGVEPLRKRIRAAATGETK